MSIELLDRTRKVNHLLAETSGEKVAFSDICAMMGGFLGSSVFVISRRGKLLGAYINPDLRPIDGFRDAAVGSCAEERLNERFLSVLSTKENVNLETLGLDEYEAEGLTALIAPIMVDGERLGTFFLYREDKTYRIDDIILCEYCNMIIGLVMTTSLLAESGEETNKREAISSAIRTLSELEQRAVAAVIHSLGGMSGRVITSQLAAEYHVTRSVMVNALRKLESARLIRTQSAGVKGTKIEVLNDIAYDEFERIYNEKWNS
ncbi:MAG: GTP-sensing pleiotropic transcriptional regulator CodY [Eubacterium sp.]|nr:GTP-sensing pleiotropic transcriptional regulator CodY [Eubacterium sp.]